MADPYTITDPIREMLERSRAADFSAARNAMAGPIPDPPKPPIAAPTAAPVAAGEAAAGRAGMQATPGVRGLLTAPGLAAAGAIAGSVGSIRDVNSGYRDQFNDSIGAETPMQTFGADVLRTLGNVGDKITGGVATKLGQGLSNVLNGDSFGDGFSQTSTRDAFYERPAGPVTAASKAGTRVAGIAQSNPDLFDVPNGTGRTAVSAPGLAGAVGSTTSAPGITRLDGGQFRAPMFTDDPARAANEYGAKKGTAGSGGYMEMPPGSSGGAAAGARSFLSAAFARHVASGDIDRAMATADPNDPTQQAAIGNMLRQNQMAQAQAAQMEPLQRMLMESLGRSKREQKLDEDVRTRAFDGVSGRVQPRPQGDGGNMQALMQAITANQQRGSPEASPMMQAIAQTGAQQAQADSHIATALKQAQAQSAITLANLQAAFAKETDPKKREALAEQIQVLSGKYDKSATQQTKLFPVDVDTGQKDVMGQPIYKKGLFDPETKQMVGGTPPAAKPTRESLDAEAKAAIAAGADKAAVNARLQQKIKELGL